ncbi:iron complex outermembrane receptor protein [Mangrovibacter plantisponsor]|uniref:Iron complex outermembrane receptor protein n=1 Tax=Mangrovibacter plantisponsor TaxID=451513 RepID=A0A317PZH1_9ENTR|nr:iron complex outermembrane receptor protein [Mangrovibacter plantisponsor]
MSNRQSTCVGKGPRILALLISSAIFPALAVGTATDSQSTNTSKQETTHSKKVDTITVTASPDNTFQPGGDELVPAYLDGQVANGGRLGMLGEQSAMDVPFNVVGYTSKLVQDQQAHTIAEVVANDAGVQSTKGYGTYAETYRIRGFTLNGDDMTMGGLPGVVPRQVVDTQMLERIEIFKGANALLNGAAGTGVGGMINLEPKRAEDTPITRVGVDYTSDSRLGGSLDVGRRFGDNNQFGARVNLLHREGEGAVDNDKRRTTLASLGLDYRGDRLRSSLDFGYQKKTFHGSRGGVNISGVDFIPAVPGSSTNYTQKWSYSDIENEFGMAKSEYDLLDDGRLTAYAALGGQHARETGESTTPALTDTSGDATVSRMKSDTIIDTLSGMAGLRSKFDTGFVSHNVNVGYSAFTSQTKSAYAMNFFAPTSTINIYSPQDVAKPEADYVGGKYSDPSTTIRSRTQGWLLSDTLGVLDDKLLFTLGARYQKVVLVNYDYNSGAETSHFEDNRWMPTYGVVYKPWKPVSFYANHTEALQPGDSIGVGALNYGQSLGIIHSKQNEVGVKMDFGRVGGSLALFEIKKPSAINDYVGSNYYTRLDGEQRNRGIELNVFGEPMLGLRLNASTTWIDPELSKTENGTNDGNDAIGVPRFVGVLGAEYDIPHVEGLTATARVNHTGSQYADAANTKKLDSYTTLDLGVRYRMQLNADKNEMVWRVGVENVTNEKYWASVESYGSYIFQGDPRTLKVSMTYDF